MLKANSYNKMSKNQVNTKTIEYSSLKDISKAAQAILAFGKSTPIWLFEGQMGAGKTTLIKAICECMLVNSHVQSPTYSIVNEYATTRGENIYHFDFYRIKSEEEAMDIGIEDYFYSGGFCFIEWPSKVENLLPSKHLKVNIEVDENGKRVITLSKV